MDGIGNGVTIVPPEGNSVLLTPIDGGSVVITECGDGGSLRYLQTVDSGSAEAAIADLREGRAFGVVKL